MRRECTNLRRLPPWWKAVSPKPVNVLVSSHNCDLSVAQPADLGVRRISVGGALARAAWGGLMRASRRIIENGSSRRLR